MKLPGRESAYVSPEKLRDYLLSRTHAVGKAKARYLHRLGFHEANLDELRESLLAIVRSEDVKEVVPSRHGTKFVVDGALGTPSGSVVMVRTVWIIDAGQTSPRFVTAYPLRSAGEET